jgi:hypothetical protein
MAEAVSAPLMFEPLLQSGSGSLVAISLPGRAPSGVCGAVWAWAQSICGGEASEPTMAGLI